MGQNYDLYLKKAFELLEKGDIKNAQKVYSVYCTMTESRDLTFEKRLEGFKKQIDWKSKCYIIKLDDSTDMAVQKLSKSQVNVSHITAEVNAKTSRLGGFLDWRL